MQLFRTAGFITLTVKQALAARRILNISLASVLVLLAKENNMDIWQAKEIAYKYIRDNIEPPDDDIYVIVDAATVEKDGGWYFSWQTKKYIDTRDINCSVVGNCPVFVSKDGRQIELRPYWS